MAKGKVREIAAGMHEGYFQMAKGSPARQLKVIRVKTKGMAAGGEKVRLEEPVEKGKE